jgi:Icc-related predicted phosphoesterase
MKLLVASDLHGGLQRIEQLNNQILHHIPDLIIICGDLTHYGSISETHNILFQLSIESIPIFFVPGNLDPSELRNQANIHHARNLHGKGVTFNEYNFIGIGGSVYTPFNTRFELSENEIQTLLYTTYDQLPTKSKHIIVSHNPPYNTQLDKTSMGDHVGSKALIEFIVETQPLLILCGHIHEALGIDQVNNSIIINPGPLFDGYYGMVEIDLDDNISVDLCQL